MTTKQLSMAMANPINQCGSQIPSESGSLKTYLFSSVDKSYTIKLTREQISGYPECFFDIMINSKLLGNLSNGVYSTKLTTETLEHVQYFFNTGYWHYTVSPHMHKADRLQIDGEKYSFTQICEYLNLPEDIEDFDDDDDYDDDEDMK